MRGNGKLLPPTALFVVLAAGCVVGGCASDPSADGEGSGAPAGGQPGGGTPDGTPDAPAEEPRDPALRLSLPLDQAEGDVALNAALDEPVPVVSPYHPVEWVEGVDGGALRLDGYSVHVDAGRPLPEGPVEALSITLWAAVEAYPVTNAPFVNQYVFPEQGFFLGLEPHGRWYFAVAVDGVWHTAFAEGPFPRESWHHVAATFDAGEGLRVYLDGAEVGRADTPAGRPMTPAAQPMLVGRDIASPLEAGLFPTGYLNGLVDEVRVYVRRLAAEDVQAAWRTAVPVGPADLAVPATRFADDVHRPRYHPIPPAGWTNEPHALIRFRDRWHLFYQKNPSGPYWAHIHWGHMTSADLVHWEHPPIALSPEPGWDSKGIWSGGIVVRNDVPTIVYTGVDPVRAAVGLAFGDAELIRWTKYEDNPVIAGTPEGYLDFRDPYVWQEESGFYLLIGTGVPDLGGTALLYHSFDLQTWSPRGELLTSPEEVAGRFWEMPVLVPVGDGLYAFLVTTVELPNRPRGLYWIGRWEGGRFTPLFDAPKQQDVNNDHLSPTVAFDEGGRLVGIGVVPEQRSSEAQLAAGWAQAFNLPRELFLCTDGVTLCQRPARELEALRGAHSVIGSRPILPGQSTVDLQGRQLELRVVIAPEAAEAVGVTVYRDPEGREETRFTYYPAERRFVIDTTRASLSPDAFGKRVERVLDVDPGEDLELRLYLDHSVIEGFVEDRRPFVTRAYPTLAEAGRIDVFAEGGQARLVSLDVWEMQP